MSPKSNSAAALSAAPCLEQVSGEEKGRVFELTTERLSIGRSENNDVVIVSEAVSRYHAVVERAENGEVVIRDNESKNGVVVNGNKGDSIVLQHGDVVQIGNFIFRYHGPTHSEDPAPFASDAMNEAPYPAQAMASLAKPRGKRNNRPLIYAGVGLLLFYAWYSQQSDKPAEPTAAESDKPAQVKLVAPTLDLSKGNSVTQLEDPSLSKVEQQLENAQMGNSGVKESEAYFRRGLREFENKNYHRAIEAFRASISLYRNHELAQYYLRLSVYEVELDARKHMENGRKYFESMQYSRAIFHFKQVISQMEHRPTDPMVGEAEKYIVQSQRRLEAAEQFP